MAGARADAVVVTYRSAEVVGDCLEALRSDSAVGKIIVVNNSPGDATQAIVDGYPGVTYHELGRNAGFGTAVNYATDYVEEDFVLLANPDTRADANTTTELLQFLQANPSAAIAAPRMRFPDGRLYCNSQHRLSLTRMAFETLGWPEAFQVSRTRRSHRSPHETDYVIGSFMLCRVAACESVGWFDDSIFLFGEDQDLCRRLRRAGWEIWYAGVGGAVHSSGHSWRQGPDSAREHFREARYRELRADAGVLPAGLYRAAARLASVVKGRERAS
jgi:GT2 family glycosyltransferase